MFGAADAMHNVVKVQCRQGITAGDEQEDEQVDTDLVRWSSLLDFDNYSR